MINFLADTFYCPGETYSHPSSWICDGYSDCYDGYDEIGCGENLDFSANNHQSAVRRLAPLGHSILIDRYQANYYFLFLDNAACLAEKQQISIILEHANAHN
jgi:hypothetical protein